MQRLSGGLLAIVWFLAVLYLVTGSTFVKAGCTGVLAAFLFCTAPQASVHIRFIFAAGVIAALWSVVGAGDWGPVRRGLEAGIVVGAFFPTLVLLRAAADQSPLISTTRERLNALDERQQEGWMQALSHVLGSFLMVGAYLIARSALPERLSEERRARLAQSGVIGMCLAACWSPFFLAPAVASQLVPSVQAWQLVALGAPLAVIGWILSKLLLHRGSSMTAGLRNVARFALPSAVLVAVVIAVSFAFGLKSMESIVLVVPLVCLGYLATRGAGATGRALARVPPALGRLADEIIVFVTSLTIGAVVAGTGAGKGLSLLLAGIAGIPVLLIAAEVALLAGLGYIGVHPMVTATLMLPVLAEAHSRSVANVVAAYIVVFGWLLSSMLSIWQIPVAAAATTFELPVGRLSLGRNLRFVLLFGACGCLALAAVNYAMQ